MRIPQPLANRGDRSSVVTRSARSALGTPQYPAPERRVHAKFVNYATPRIGDAAADLLGRLTHLDEVPDVAELLKLTRRGAVGDAR